MASGIHAFTVQEGVNVQLGQGGYIHIDQAGTDNTGTAADGVEYVAITVLEAATVTTVSNDPDVYPDLAAIPVPAGTTIYGRWNKVTVATTNGTALCYRG
tara:strand:- start:152 stop:451 length:300 start_codon:yes stop_codon:yes gene_type:complete